MTIGELARFFNEYFEIKAPLEVIPMEGWKRSMYLDQTGLPFVMPSPNIPTLDSAIVYPGTVLFEGTNASEARGTTRPFELVGAPWVEAERFADEMNARKLPGVHFRPAVFEPTFQKHAKKTCGGCQIHVLDRKAFKPVLTGVALIDAIKAAGPKDFAWRKPPYEYEHEKEPIDILAGSPALRIAIDGGKKAEDLCRSGNARANPSRKFGQNTLRIRSLWRTEAKILDITRTQLIQAPPARVMQAFFTDTDLKGWWGVTRAFTVPRPLGMYAIEWETTDFKDEVLGRLGGAFHGTIIDYRAHGAFFLAEAYWQPPDGEPIGPMALEVHCRPHGNNRQTMVTVRQSAAGEGSALAALFRGHGSRLGRRARRTQELHRSRNRADQDDRRIGAVTVAP